MIQLDIRSRDKKSDSATLVLSLDVAFTIQLLLSARNLTPAEVGLKLLSLKA